MGLARTRAALSTCVERCYVPLLMTVLATMLLAGCDDEGDTCGSDIPQSSTSIAHARTRAMRAVECDSQAIVSRVASSGIATTEANTLKTRTRNLAQRARAALSTDASISARLPLSPEHQQMYEVAAEAERASGSGVLLVWAANPWAPLDPLERPAEHSQQLLSTALMRGERRALALNIRTTATEPSAITLAVILSGLTEQDVQVHRVNWTGNDRSEWIATELEPVELSDGKSALQLLPGVTQQIWIQVYAATSTAPGRHAGSVRLESADAASLEVPIELQVFARALPDQLSTHFGGWDYADGSSNYAVTAANRAQLIEQLQARFVDTPWAQRAVLNWDNIGANGEAIAPPDASALARWLEQWPSARRFRVFLGVEDGIGAISTNDARFATAVRAWASGWAEQIRLLGRSASDFDLLLVDEPQTPEQVRTTVAWAQAIGASGAGFRIWTDPVWRDTASVQQELIDAADTISVNLGAAENAGTAYWDWARGLSRQGKSVELYACDGPSRRLDPYAYYRLTPWRAFAIGAQGVSFWSFADTRNGGGDDEFAAIEPNYSPLFITRDRVRSSRHMEAAVEGLQDIEYLRMLRQVADTSGREDVRLRARELLDSTLSQVLGSVRSSNAQWTSQGESTLADRQRRVIGEFLDSLEE